jgi:hypothetical protein
MLRTRREEPSVADMTTVQKFGITSKAQKYSLSDQNVDEVSN